MSIYYVIQIAYGNGDKNILYLCLIMSACLYWILCLVEFTTEMHAGNIAITMNVSDVKVIDKLKEIEKQDEEQGAQSN